MAKSVAVIVFNFQKLGLIEAIDIELKLIIDIFLAIFLESI